MQRIPTPTKDEIAALEAFPQLGMAHITLAHTTEQAQTALQALQTETVVGFDTESKPTFLKDQVSTGPHVVQFATVHRAYVFQLHDATCQAVVCRLLTNPAILKVGFGLGGDLTQIRRRLGVEPVAVLDINTLFRAQGYVKEIGVKSAVAVVFRQRFIKSRKATTSNWSNHHLTPHQIVYAGNDAWAALRVYLALDALPLNP